MNSNRMRPDGSLPAEDDSLLRHPMDDDVYDADLDEETEEEPEFEPEEFERDDAPNQ